MKTFKAADGRRVRASMTEEQIVQRELLNMATVVMPILTILLFAIAGRLI